MRGLTAFLLLPPFLLTTEKENEMRPNVWGQGLLFAYSGWDGPTDWSDDFVCVAAEEPFGWSIEGGKRLAFRLITPERDELRIVRADLIASDHLSMRLDGGGGVELEVRMAMVDGHSLLGSVETQGGGTEVSLQVERPEWCEQAEGSNGCLVLRGSDGSMAVRLEGAEVKEEKEGRIRLGVDAAEGKPVLFAISRDLEWIPTHAGLGEAYAPRAAFFDAIPKPPEALLAPDPDGRGRAYLKAASVIKVNLHSAQGVIPHNWSTPDRVPHRHMWLWDSAFHAIGLRHLDPALAQDQIRSVVAHVREDGFLPHCVQPDGHTSKITQPPILGWAAWKVHEASNDPGFLAAVYPPLKRFLEFFPRQRDRDGNGLCEWEDGDASGMDNSPRFDSGAEFDAIDLNCFLVREYRTMAQMAEAIGGDIAPETERWNRLADEASRQINADLRDESTGFYLDRPLGGERCPLKTSCGLLPLFAGVASPEQAVRLVHHLKDPAEFWTPFPVPSVARDEETYSKDMWRGPTWVNYNYLIIEGLRNYGLDDVAHELAEITISQMARTYLEDGVIFEIYDAEAEVSPRVMPRKGRTGGTHWKNTVVRDYHWSAAVFLALALEEFRS